MIRAKENIERGIARPARVWEVRTNPKGGFNHRALDPEKFQRNQKAAWSRSFATARHKLGLSQPQFAKLLGISVRTLHHWEHGTRRPSGAARVLLRVAVQNPEAVLKAAA